MKNQCKQGDAHPETTKQLEIIIQDADPMRIMELVVELKDIGTKKGILSDTDRTQLTHMHHLAAAIIKDKMLPTT